MIKVKVILSKKQYSLLKRYMAAQKQGCKTLTPIYSNLLKNELIGSL